MQITETKDSPYFLLDGNLGLIMIKGWSSMLNSKEFYEPILEVIKIYVDTKPQYTKMIVDLDRFNTSSSKYLLEIFNILRQLIKMELKVEVDWYYDDTDDSIHEAGGDYSEIVKDLTFNLILKK
jgi:hypothetical protein